jgi:dTDP-4-amino-4,6-dideoxygalactose transaminase
MKNESLEVVGFSKSLQEEGAGSVHSWMLVPIRVKGPNAEKRKSKIVTLLNELGIETRPILTGNFLSQPAIRRLFPEMPSPEEFPVSSLITNCYFMVGCHHDFTDSQVAHLVSAFARASDVE